MGIEDSFIWWGINFNLSRAIFVPNSLTLKLTLTKHFCRYQKKIGTYDKQQWETSIEQKILNGLNNISMRNTKPNTNLIDLDLVRGMFLRCISIWKWVILLFIQGSSFTKAKPQHGLLTVVKQATLRCVLLPFFAKWWIRRTSKTEFGIFLFLYMLLWINIAIYFVQGHSLKESDISMVSVRLCKGVRLCNLFS